MSAGAVFTIISNDGKADRLIMATDLLELRAQEILSVPVSYQVPSGGSPNLAGVGGVVLFDPSELEFIGYTPAFATELFHKPDKFYPEADLYDSLTKAGMPITQVDFDNSPSTTAGIPFAYVPGSDATTAGDSFLIWPNNNSPSSSTGLKLFDLRFKAKSGFTGSPLNVVLTTTSPDYAANIQHGQVKLAAASTLLPPVITAISADSGTAGDFLTNDTTLTVTGTCDATNSTGGGATIIAVDSAGTAISGGFSRTYSLGEANGLYSIGTDTSPGTWALNLSGTTLIAGLYKVIAFSTGAGSTRASSEALITIDPSNPILTITASKTRLLKDEVATIIFTFSEEVSAGSFSFDDITITNGTGALSALTQSTTDRKVFTATFTPATATVAQAVISVAEGKVNDLAGNPNAAANLTLEVATAAAYGIGSSATRDDALVKLEGTGTTPTVFTFTVTRSGDTRQAGSVDWSLKARSTDGSASPLPGFLSSSNQVNATDFGMEALPKGSVSFAPGDTSKTIDISVVADSTFEADESFVVELSNPNPEASSGPGIILSTAKLAAAIVVNDDAAPPRPVVNNPAFELIESTSAIKSGAPDATKVTLNPQAISFNLDTTKQQSTPGQSVATPATTTVDLSLVVPTASLYDTVNNKPQRKANTFISYYTIDDSGKAEAFLYDYEKKTGARFFNVDGRTLADLTFPDNPPVGKDPTIGAIRDLSVGGVCALNPTLSATADTLTISDPENSTPAALNLKATITARPSTSNEIGFVLLNAGEKVSDLTAEILKSRGRVLFNTLENSDTTEFKKDDVSGNSLVSLTNTLQIVNGRTLAFYEVKDGTTTGINTRSDFNLLTTTETGGKATAKSSSGFEMKLALDTTESGLASMLGRDQALAPLLNLNGLNSTDTITGTIVTTREADYNNVMGFYRVENIDGAVRDTNGNLILPTAFNREAYIAAAKAAVVASLDGFKVDDNKSESAARSFTASPGYLAPYATVNNTTTYFAYASVNADNFSHFKMLALNVIGFEDTDFRRGSDKDFDDHIVAFVNPAVNPLPA